MVEQDNLDVPMIVTAGVVSVVLTVFSIIGVQALYANFASAEMDRKVTTRPTFESNSKLAEQDAKLAQYGWADREKGKVVIPIERAMDRIAKESAK